VMTRALTGQTYGVTVTPLGSVWLTGSNQLHKGDVFGIDAGVLIGGSALNVAHTPNGGVLVITHNNTANSLSVRSAFDGSDGGVLVGHQLFGLALGQQGVYAGKDNGSVLFVAFTTGMATLSVGAGVANGLAFDAPRGLIYGTTTGGNVFVIDGATNSLVADAGWSGAGSLQQPVISPDGTTLYIANEGTGVERWDIASKTRTGLVPNTGGAFGLALTPDGQQLWATRSTQGTVDIIDLASFTVVRSIPNLGTVRRLAFDPTGQVCVVASETQGAHFIR
jgi:DNA-binding beta-propeller fold protein YncE